jgi:DNA helicase-2/ATP-dependent DNA helicase PcrA
MLAWLKDTSSQMNKQTRSKLYVAITRARFSVGFVISDNKVNEFQNDYDIWEIPSTNCPQ